MRVLAPEDAPAWSALRLRALREHPEAFATSYEEELRRSGEEVRARLAPGPERFTLGAFVEGRLAGGATLVRHAQPRQRHRATLAWMYVAPEARGRGLARLLLERALQAARRWEGVTDVALAVTVGNGAARALYASAGFAPYGVEPRSLCVDGRFHDTEWMGLRLR